MASFTYPSDFAGTGWLVIDGDIYISSIGSDINGDGSPGNPYATIQKGVIAAVTDQKIVVGTGTYIENIDGLQKNLQFIADGQVILNGTYIKGEAFSNLGDSLGSTSRLESFIIVGYDSAIDNRVGVAKDLILIKCGLTNFRGEIRNCVIEKATIAATASAYLYNCTFIDVQTLSAGYLREILDCHFDKDCVFNLVTTGTTTKTDVFDYCNQEPGSVINIDSTDYLDADSVFVAFPSSPAFQEHGLSEVPQFNVPIPFDYTLQSTSPLLFAGSLGQHIGAAGRAVAQSYSTLMGAATLTNVTIDTKGRYHLVPGATNGTILTPMIDIGSERLLGKINLFALQHFEEPPGNAVVDKSNTVSNPNNITFQMRSGGTVEEFEAAPFKEFIWDKDPTIDDSGKSNGQADFNVLTSAGIVARYVQLLITLNDNTSLLLQENGCLLLQEDGYAIKL